MLPFEFNPETGTLEVFFDAEGKATLRKGIGGIHRPGDHDHLMTPAWAGAELSEEAHQAGNVLITNVTRGIPRADVTTR